MDVTREAHYILKESHHMTNSCTTSAADVRAEIARRQVPIYRLASRVGLHPSHLGQAIRGRRPLSPELAHRIWQALDDETGDLLPVDDARSQPDAATV